MLKPRYFSDIVPLIVESDRVFHPISAFQPVEDITHFRQGERGNGLLVTGWGEPELVGVWSVNHKARITFTPPADEGRLFASLSIAVAFTAFTMGNHSQRIRIACDEEDPISIEVAPGEDRPYVVKLVALNRGQPIVIDFDLPDCVAPFAFSDSPDRRRLGIQLRWMAIAQGGNRLPEVQGLASAIFVGCTAEDFEVPSEDGSPLPMSSSTITFLPGPDWNQWPPQFTVASHSGCQIDFRVPSLAGLSGFEESEETGCWISSEPAQFSFSADQMAGLVATEAHNLVLLLEPFAPPVNRPILFIRTSDHRIFFHLFREGDRSLRVVRVGPVIVEQGKPFTVFLQGGDLVSPKTALGESDNRELAVRLRLACLTSASAPLPAFTHGMEVAEALGIVSGIEPDARFGSGRVDTQLAPSSDSADGDTADSDQSIPQAAPAHPENVAESPLEYHLSRTSEQDSDVAHCLTEVIEQLSRLERLILGLGKNVGGLSMQTAGLSTIEQAVFRISEIAEQTRQDNIEREKRIQASMSAFSGATSRLTNSMHAIVEMVTESTARQFSIQRDVRNIAEQQSRLTERFEVVDWKSLHEGILNEHRLTEAGLRKLDVVARRQILEVDEDTLALHVDYGYVLVPRRDLRLVLSIHDSVGIYEPGTQAIMAHLLRAGMQVVDVGANIGLHTLCMGRLVGPTGKVWAIEPSQEIAVCLGRTIEANGLQRVVAVLPVAAGDRKEKVALHIGTTSGLSSLYPLGIESNIQDTQMDRLDNLIPIQMDFLKIDAEGSEIMIMEGMGGYLDYPDLAIVAEYGAQHIKKSRLSPAEWFGCFEERGFNCYMINDDKNPILTTKLAVPLDGNYLFIRDRSRVKELLEG